MRGKLTLFLIMLNTWLMAQQGQSTAGFTLDDCIAYALEHAVDIRNARLDEQIAEARVKETIGIGLPQVSGKVTVQQSPTQARFFSQYLEPEAGQESGFNILTAEQAQQLGVESGDVFAAENFFQLKGYGDAGISINQLIFNGSYIVGLQASNAYKDLSAKQYNETREGLVLNVSKAYYNLLISREQLDQLNSNITRMDTLYQNTSAMYQNGFAERIDVDRLKVNLNNLRVEESNLQNMNDLALRLLKFQMNYPFEEQLIITDSIGNKTLQEAVLAVDGDWSYAERADYQVLQANYELQKLNVKNKYAEAIPVISGFANLGYTTQSPDFGGLFQTEADFEGIDGFGPDTWYGYSTLGLSLSWNLFTGLQRTFQIQQEKLNLLKLENNFEVLERSIDLDIERSRGDLETAMKRLEVQEENKVLAEEIFRVAQIKYEEGVGSNLEVIDADTALKESQTNYYSALYDSIIAQLELKKALGILYN